MRLQDLLGIDPSSPTPVYAQIEEQLARLVMTGHYKAKERIPSVRELAVTLRVNPLTVSKAYGRLSDRGLVKTVRGKGVFVAEKPPEISAKEKERRMAGKIDLLLAEARQMGMQEPQLAELFRKRLGRLEG